MKCHFIINGMKLLEWLTFIELQIQCVEINYTEQLNSSGFASNKCP